MTRRDGWLVEQLPPGMLQEDFFHRFVQIFEAQAGTLMAHADNLDVLADPDVTPDAMLGWLASWIGLRGVDGGAPGQRALLRTAARTLGWRGTPWGLRTLLEEICDGPVVVEEGGGVWPDGEAPADTAWVVVRVPSTGALDERAFVEVVADEIPAHVRAELWVGDRLVWPRASSGTARAGRAGTLPRTPVAERRPGSPGAEDPTAPGGSAAQVPGPQGDPTGPQADPTGPHLTDPHPSDPHPTAQEHRP